MSLKVWGGLTVRPKVNPQVRTVVAANSKREAAKLVGVSMYEFNNYWNETGNKAEVAAAMSKPGTVFKASDASGSDFEPEEN